MLEDERHRWPIGLARADVDSVLVVVSDIEMGPGGPTDDFPQSEALGELLLDYCRPPFSDVPLTVVFNGDTFDLLKTSHEGAFPVHVSEPVAVAKMQRVLTAHAPFFAQLRRLLAHAGAPRALSFVVGNHDVELLYPGVQAQVAAALGDHPAVSFPGLSLRVGDVRIEHGHQHDPMFAQDAERPFIEHEGRTVLNLPWGTVAILEVALQFLPELHALDRLKPKAHVLEALPEVRDLLMESYWRYWTRDFWQAYLASRDPLRRVSWTMLKEVVYRIGTGDPDVSSADSRRFLHERHDGARLLLLGHEHEPALSSLAGRRVLRTGCFRNEYLLDLTAGEHELLPKVYAEVYLRERRAVRAQLVEVDLPPPEPTVPRAISDVLPDVRRLLAERKPPDNGARLEARHEQERVEAGLELTHQRPGFVATLRTLLGSDEER